MLRRLAALLPSALLAIACGGSAPRAQTVVRGDVDDAIAAWSRGELDDARALAEAHLEAHDDSDIAREIAARAALAAGDAEAALSLTRDRRPEPLVRLRAAAHLAQDDYAAAAAALASLGHADDDPWAVAVSQIATAARGRDLHQRDGAPRAELALREDCALPVVAIRVEGRDALALIATSVHLTVLGPALRAEHGVADELELGRARVRDVPFVVRDLAMESAALGVPIEAVLGTDLLGRLGVALDGPAARLIVGAERPPGGVPSARFDGSVLAVRASVGSGRAWLLLDTAGAFAVALSPRGAERLGVGEGNGDGALATVGLGSALTIDGVPLELGIVGDELEDTTTAPIGGAIGWGLLAQTTIVLDRAGVALVASPLSS